MEKKRNKNYFNVEQLETVNHAVAVSEDIISDRFQLTISAWKKYRYDIRTQKALKAGEMVPEVFAQIIRYGRPAPPDGLRVGDFYSICLQDHNILGALDREPELRLLPLLLYVITHELVHVIRFYKFVQFFDADEAQRAAEEIRVHQQTYELLQKIKLADMEQIFRFYAEHRSLVD